MNKLKVKFIANSAVLIKTESVRILVDGIYGKNPYFTPPQKEIQKAVFGMNSIYRDIDYLLFTHRHSDHFDAAYTNEYVKNNSVKGVYVPVASEFNDSYLEDQRKLGICRNKGILNEFVPNFGETLFFEPEEGIKIYYYRTDHLDGKSYPVFNTGICIDIFGKRLFFVADSDFSERNYDVFVDQSSINCIFVTPLFLAHASGRNIINRIKPDSMVIYHLPDEADDSSGLRELGNKVMKSDYACPVSIFNEEGQIVEL